MKNKFIVTLLAAVLGIALLAGMLPTTGCTTTTTGTGTNVVTTTTADINKIAAGVQIATSAGTKYALMKVPDTRPYFVASVTTLDALVLQASTTNSPPDLAAAFAKLPVAELQSAEAQLAISTLQDIYTTTLADTVAAGLDPQSAAVKILTALDNGVKQALAAVPAGAHFKVSFQK